MAPNLATVLGFKALDRLQINDHNAIREMWFDNRMDRKGELPFWYFQRILDDGRLEVRSPGGCAASVAPKDVCDVIPGKPVSVLALPEPAFRDRLKRTRNDPPIDDSDRFATALVLYAMKDRWGYCDFYVWFDDPILNTTGRPWRAIMNKDERNRIEAHARRSIMPVLGGRSANYSADAGCESSAAFHSALAKQFFASALAGQHKAVSRLAIASASPLSRAALNKLSK